MDIAKIRKKAKEQEAADGQPEGAQEAAREQPRPAPQAIEPEAAPARELPEPSEPDAVQAAEEAPAERRGTVSAEAAPPEEEERGRSNVVELLTFSLGSEEFAFRVPEVEEIVRYQKITMVPTVPAYVSGITSLRGKIIPIIDLKRRLVLGGREEESHDDEELRRTRKILVMAGAKGLIGAIIDRVLGVVRFPEDGIVGPPGHLSEEEVQYIEGVATLEGRFISIIRSEAALTIEVQ